MTNPIDHIDSFAARVLADALQEALPGYWRRRAEAFDAAVPRPGDYRGSKTTDAALADATRRNTDTAQDCRNHADLIAGDLPDHLHAEILELLATQRGLHGRLLDQLDQLRDAAARTPDRRRALSRAA